MFCQHIQAERKWPIEAYKFEIPSDMNTRNTNSLDFFSLSNWQKTLICLGDVKPLPKPIVTVYGA